MPSKRTAQSFSDIVDNIERIEQYTAGIDHVTLYSEAMRIDAVERCLSRLTEAAARLGKDAETLAPGMPWNDIRAFGNHLRHGYDRLQPTSMWKTITEDLPPLKRVCLAALTKLHAKK